MRGAWRWVACLAWVPWACTTPGESKTTPAEVTGVFTVGAPHFLDVPWPSNLLLRADGTRIVDNLPNPTASSMLEVYRTELAKGRNWGLNTSLMVRFDAPLDPASLPQDPSTTMTPDGRIQLVDVDASSPERGNRVPLRLAYAKDETLFLSANVLTVLPVLGFPLRPATTYALVVLDTVTGANGGRVAPSADLTALLGTTAPSDARLSSAWTLFAPLRDSASTVHVDLAHVVQATVFTTDDPLPPLQKARDRVVAGAPYPTAAWSRPADFDSHPTYYLYEGTISLPQFQQGVPPFDLYDGTSGGFQLDETGTPVVQRSEACVFAMSVPRTPPPPGGYCLVVVGHGTGGDYRTFVGDGHGDETHWITDAGCAAVSISQPLHRTREGWRSGSEEILTFNFLNPPAGTGNWRQSALESSAMLHSPQSFAVPASVSHTGADIPIRQDAKLYFGHSQGGITGAILAGVEKELDVGILSGAGGGFAESILEKTEPVVIANAIRLLLGLEDNEPLDEFHPVLAILQLLGEVLEPLNGARQYYAPGRKAPNLLIYSGLVDVYTPPRTHGPLAAAAGIPLINPVSQAVPSMDLRGLMSVASPVETNMSVAPALTATSVMAQWPTNGHFAIYENRAASTMATVFLRSYVDTGTAQAIR